MAQQRLEAAIDAGEVVLPEDGTILVSGPDPDMDLSCLDPARVKIVTRFRPDFDAWSSRGFETLTEESPAAAAIVCVPKARDEALLRISQAVASVPKGAPVVVDGTKKQGVEGILRRLKPVVGLGMAFSKAHGKIAQFAATELLPEWAADHQIVDGRRTAPGVFSADGSDPGSRALLAAIPKLNGRVCDLGAGWGYLAERVLADSSDVTTVDLVEANLDALDAAKANVRDARARFHWADAATFGDAASYETVISNPPFHIGRAADPSLGRAFIASAGRVLKRHGQFFMVANRHLPYEGALNEVFAEVEELSGSSAFKVFAARKPKAAKLRR